MGWIKIRERDVFPIGSIIIIPCRIIPGIMGDIGEISCFQGCCTTCTLGGIVQRHRRERNHRHIRRVGCNTAVLVGHENGLAEILRDVLLRVSGRSASLNVIRVYRALRIVNPNILGDVVGQACRSQGHGTVVADLYRGSERHRRGCVHRKHE